MWGWQVGVPPCSGAVIITSSADARGCVLFVTLALALPQDSGMELAGWSWRCGVVTVVGEEAELIVLGEESHASYKSQVLRGSMPGKS